jgi:Flp pilus assembly protein TadG
MTRRLVGEPSSSDLRGSAVHEHGAITVWMLGLTAIVVLFGAISLDTWRAYSERRALQSVANAAANAGANGIDETIYRTDQTLALEPTTAETLAWDSLQRQHDRQSFDTATVTATDTRVTVIIEGHVEFGLLGLFMDDGPFQITVQADAEVRG